MSVSNSHSDYVFNYAIDTSNGANEGGFTLSSYIGFDDSLAFALLEALNGLSWPPGITAPFTVTKTDAGYVSYTTNLTTSPPSFT